MSKHGLPIGVFHIKVPRFRGKKNVKIELFPATEWQQRYRPYNKSTYHPCPPMFGTVAPDPEGVYWSQRYRLRIDGRWYGVKGKRYTFYTLPEALELAGKEFELLTKK